MCVTSFDNRHEDPGLIGDATWQSGRASGDAVPTFAAGVFLGNACQTVRTASLQFAELEATVPEREVPHHRHETPHFVLVLRGIYLTDARNQDGPCSSSTLIFNPAGTTHRDCFRSRNGRFLSVTPTLKPSRLLNRASPVARVVAGGSLCSLAGTLITGAIEREFEPEKRPSSLVLESLGNELIGQLLRPEERIESLCTPDRLLRTKEMIEDCAGSEIAIADDCSSGTTSGVPGASLPEALWELAGEIPRAQAIASRSTTSH